MFDSRSRSAPSLGSPREARALGLLLGAVLGAGCAAAMGMALLLGGGGALLLGPTALARAASGVLIALALAASLVFAKLLEPALGADGRDRVAPPDSTAPRWMGPALGLCLLLFLAAGAAHIARAPDGDWDAWSIWNARARALLRSAGDVRLACAPERGLALFTLHPDYPILLPTAVALGWRALGRESAWVPALASLLPALLTIAIAALWVARGSRRRGAWVAAILLTTPELLAMAAAQYAEAALGALVLAGLALLACAWESDDLWHANHLIAADVLHANDSAAPARNAEETWAWARQRRLLALAGLALGLSTLVKHEGALFLGAAALVLLGARPRALIPFALGALAPLCLLAWFVHGFAPASDLLPGGLRQWMHRALSATRAAAIVSALARRLLFFQRWALHLAAFTALLAVRLRRGESRAARAAPARRVRAGAARLSRRLSLDAAPARLAPAHVNQSAALAAVARGGGGAGASAAPGERVPDQLRGRGLAVDADAIERLARAPAVILPGHRGAIPGLLHQRAGPRAQRVVGIGEEQHRDPQPGLQLALRADQLLERPLGR